MTTSEQLKITAYRENGMPYSEIAKALSLSVNTVKSYCKRHDMGGRRKKSADNIYYASSAEWAFHRFLKGKQNSSVLTSAD